MKPWPIVLVLFVLATLHVISDAHIIAHHDGDSKNKTIVIVGAGISGLFSAYLLNEAGFANVILLEGRNRIGGRIKTVPYGKHHIEIGAQFLHYPHTNDAFALLQQYGEGKYDLDETQGQDYNYLQFSLEKCDQPLIEAITSFTDDVYEECGLIWDDWQEKGDLHGIPRQGLSLGEFIVRRCEKFCPKYTARRDETIKNAILDATLRITSDNEGEDAFKVSALLLGRPSSEFGDDQYQVPKKGYGELLNIIKAKIPENWIKLSQIVNHIDYSHALLQSGKIGITTTSGARYEADHVISTLPLGVLKDHAKDMFFPLLPYRKRRAIELINPGAAMKILFSLDEKVLQANDWDILETQNAMVPIWLDGANYEGRNFSEGYKQRSEDISKHWNRYIAFISRDVFNPSVWTAWLFGKSATFAETLSNEQLMDGVEECLRVTMRRLTNIGRPKFVARTGWISDPFTKGAYSSIPQTCDDELIWTGDLAEPIMNEGVPIVMFAGEATSKVSIATVQGSMKSSRREVKRLLDLYT